MGWEDEGRTETESKSGGECINTDYTSTGCLLVFCSAVILCALCSPPCCESKEKFVLPFCKVLSVNQSVRLLHMKKKKEPSFYPAPA